MRAGLPARRRCGGRCCSGPDGVTGPWCGDGVKDGYEQCEDGLQFNTGTYGRCTPSCRLAPRCGDGIVNGPEECDLGADNGRNTLCTETCKYDRPP